MICCFLCVQADRWGSFRAAPLPWWKKREECLHHRMPKAICEGGGISIKEEVLQMGSYLSESAVILVARRSLSPVSSITTSTIAFVSTPSKNWDRTEGNLTLLRRGREVSCREDAYIENKAVGLLLGSMGCTDRTFIQHRIPCPLLRTLVRLFLSRLFGCRFEGRDMSARETTGHTRVGGRGSDRPTWKLANLPTESEEQTTFNNRTRPPWASS